MTSTGRWQPKAGGLVKAAICVFVVSLIAGCGGGSGSASSADSTSETAAVTEGSSADSAEKAEGELTTVQYSSAPVIAQAAISLGVEKGFYEEEGIDLQINFDPTSAAAVALMMNGERNIIMGGLATPITAASEGLPTQFIGAGSADQTTPQGSSLGLVVAPDSGIKTWTDLEGKTIGTNSLGCCQEAGTNASVEKNGGDPSTIKWVAVPWANGPGALQEGRVDALATAQPYVYLAEQDGGVSIGDPQQEKTGLPTPSEAGLSASKPYLEENSEVVQRFLKATEKSADYANSHRSEIDAEINKLTEIPMNVVKEIALPEYTSAVSEKVVEVEVEGVRNTGEFSNVPDPSEMIWSSAHVEP